MASILDQVVMSEKVSPEDDVASTASGGSSLPSSPGNTSDLASLPSSPAKVSPEAAVVSIESVADLPSLGSVGHFAGVCSRCCFHAKGRCQNGKDCRFCHFDHEKRQRKKKVAMMFQTWPVPPTAAPAAPKVIAPPPRSTAVLPTTPITPPPGLDHPSMFASMPMAPPTTPSLHGDVEGWSVERVMDWLKASGLGHLSQSFEEHRITGDVLLDLCPTDLEEIGVHAFGDKKRLLRAAQQLQTQSTPATQTMEIPCPPPPCWEASFVEASQGFPQGPCPPPAPPPFMELQQCPLPAPPSFYAPM